MSARVDIYTRPLCLFCHQVLELLQQAQVRFQQLDIPERAEQERLLARYHAAAFPIVLVSGRYVGGYAHVLHLHAQGRLSGLNAPAAIEAAASSGAAKPSATSGRSAVPSMMDAMSRLQKALKEEDPKKR